MRKLTENDIRLLEANGCSCDDWQLIDVADNFDPDWCHEVRFQGVCSLGDLSGIRFSPYGTRYKNGLRELVLDNCKVGNRVLINKVRECLSRYEIGDDVVIHNTDLIAMTGESSFGVGTEASVLNETGGFEVPLSRNLTAQTAYMYAMLSDDKKLIRSLREMSEREVQSVRSATGYIGRGTVIKNSGTILDAYIGEYAEIDGAARLENFSLLSARGYPTRIGAGVFGEDFIACSGAQALSGAVLRRCFLGQSALVESLFSAHDSLLFSNCTMENGESCAVFAGPFTVSSHKSSLLIAGHFSFLNAGSGSNQSNHLYKMGPIHHGIVERGSKTSSDSYVLWPSKIGPFSLIMGRHVHHVDTGDFPFSYLIEDRNQSYLVPGKNLLSVGTVRDAQKWPKRDKRPKDNRLDCINYNLLSPFTIGRMEAGLNKLKEILGFMGYSDHTYTYNNLSIKPQKLKEGIGIYGRGIDKFLGNSVVQRLTDKAKDKGDGYRYTDEELRDALRPEHEDGRGEWIDLSGMIAPKPLVAALLDDIKAGKFADFSALNHEIRKLHERYYDLEWDWSYDLMLRRYDLENGEGITREFIARLLRSWLDAVLFIDRNLYEDAKKEYKIKHRINYGINVYDRDDIRELADSFEDLPIVVNVKEHMDKKTALYETAMTLLGFR